MRICREHPLHQRINAFLYSPAYIAFLGFLIVLSNVFGMELFTYTVIMTNGVYVFIYGRDFLPTMPCFILCYISPSLKNNPGFNDHSVFSLAGGGLYLIVFLCVVVISVIYRIATDPIFGGKQFFTKKRKLLPGMLLLGAAYALSGLGSGQWREYGWNNLLFAFIQFAAIILLYYVYSGAVIWEKAPRAYLFWTGTCVGYVLLFELLHIYVSEDVIAHGNIFRNKILTGWGHYNNIGALFATVIPLTFFLTGKGKLSWFAYLSATLFLMGAFLTCSRGSVAFAVPIYIASYILSLVHSRYARRQFIFHGLLLLFGIVAMFFLREEIMELFIRMKAVGLGSAGRLETYKEGIKQFLRFPVFGGSFFPIDHSPGAWAESESFLAFFPPRWHNTVIQLLASGGVVALAAYSVHRLQTINLFIRDFSTEKLFVALSILALLLCSMVDCHFFNIGPILYYSPALAVAEHQLGKKNTIKKPPKGT